MSKIQINIDILNKLSPFHFAIDAKGRIVHLGPSLKKLVDNDLLKYDFDSLFQIKRPSGITFSDLKKLISGESIILELKKNGAQFMGQIVSLDEHDIKVFIINLIVQEAEELTQMNLEFNDFAIQDPIFDYLMLLQTQKRAIKQAAELNSKLAIAHKQAIDASEVKSKFLANMSHELRTPMNGILGMASILQESTLDNDQMDWVKTIVNSGDAMLALINDILDLSKIEAGFVQLSPTTFEIEDLMKDVIQSVTPHVNKKGLSLQLSIDDKAPQFIKADRLRLRQVILNLLGNAVKFTSKGLVSVQIDTLSLLENIVELKFTVKDSGIGMSEQVLSQLFTPFVQGDNSMTKKFEGTGLGLSICKRLVEAMDGKIEVKSKENEGSEFSFTVKVEYDATGLI